ncbi:MAG TPA: hypothetical protein VE074_02480, partial [Jatrophihabitantaceae bacterium]|nr:hypothetical protein [Jatrophihabitantaceae bacterium]
GATALHRVQGSGVTRLAMLGSGDTSVMHSPVARGSLYGYGVSLDVHLGSPACGGAVELPLSLTVGAWLLADALGPSTGAVGFSIGPDFAASRAAVDLLALAESERVGLIVMGDGSARHSTKAPGYLDPRAEPFDEGVVAALRDGDIEALAGLDAALGAELLASGVPAWQAAAAVLSGDYDAELLYADAPYGVGYFAAAWTARA